MSQSELQTITIDLENVRGGCCVNVSVNGQQVFGSQGADPAALAQQAGAQAAGPAGPAAAAQPSAGQGINPAAIGQQIGGLVDQFVPGLGGKGAAVGGQLGNLAASFMGGGQQ
jgi:hypothetical protein